MDLLMRDAEFVPCPQCGQTLRKGMIRCRECNAVVTEDFVLSETVASAMRRCGRCGVELERGVIDCPTCASEMLDQLLNAPPPEPVISPRSSARFAAEESLLRDDPAVEEEVPRPAATNGRRKKHTSAATRARANEEAGMEVLFESETDASAQSSSATVADVTQKRAGPDGSASEACKSLISALSTSDPEALCQVVAALGNLGERRALKPLEKLLSHDQSRVRRAVVAALIRLGHPKGDALLDVIEQQPVEKAESIESKEASASGYSKARANRKPTNWSALAVPGSVVAVGALIAGGIWFWQSQPASPTMGNASSVKKPVASAPAVATPAAPKAAVPKAPATNAVAAKPAAPRPTAPRAAKRAPAPGNDYDP